MNWQLSVCVGAFSCALVIVLTLGGWMRRGMGGSWPLLLAVSATSGALFGPSMRLQVPSEFWRKKK
ncbi:MAG: hypothetical protein OXI66_06975 [Boseongicola sp.]|nr:hypothetical protein [Boseongicola sp.]